MHVLISEAIDPVRSRLASLVREQPGVDVAATTSGLDATLESFRRHKPSLLILGSRLADASGFDVLRALAGELQSTSVILLCHQLDSDYLYSGHSLGADFVLEAPRDIELIPSLMSKLQNECRRAQGESHVR